MALLFLAFHSSELIVRFYVSYLCTKCVCYRAIFVLALISKWLHFGLLDGGNPSTFLFSPPPPPQVIHALYFQFPKILPIFLKKEEKGREARRGGRGGGGTCVQ